MLWYLAIRMIKHGEYAPSSSGVVVRETATTSRALENASGLATEQVSVRLILISNIDCPCRHMSGYHLP